PTIFLSQLPSASTAELTRPRLPPHEHSSQRFLTAAISADRHRDPFAGKPPSIRDFYERERVVWRGVGHTLAMRARSMTVGTVLVVALLAAACGGSSSKTSENVGGSTAPSSGGRTSSWVDEPVSFRAAGVTVGATFRHPVGMVASMPAAVLIAGSGPTDRDGNSPLERGPVNTLSTLAAWLSADGVA